MDRLIAPRETERIECMGPDSSGRDTWYQQLGQTTIAYSRRKGGRIRIDYRHGYGEWVYGPRIGQCAGWPETADWVRRALNIDNGQLRRCRDTD